VLRGCSVIFVTDETMRLLVACTPSFNQKGFKMKINIGSMDRILRIIVGLALIALAAAGIIGVWGWIGVVPLPDRYFQILSRVCRVWHEHLSDGQKNSVYSLKSDLSSLRDFRQSIRYPLHQFFSQTLR